VQRSSPRRSIEWSGVLEEKEENNIIEDRRQRDEVGEGRGG
jgi:hypothetical protein